MLGTSSKENEFRLPIHPLHLDRIDADLRRRIVLETGYGERFGVHDGQLAPLVGGMLPAAKLIDACDIVLLPKRLRTTSAGCGTVKCSGGGRTACEHRDHPDRDRPS